MPLQHRPPVTETPETQDSPRLETKKSLTPILSDPTREGSDTDMSIVVVNKAGLMQEPLPESRITTTAQGTLTPKRRSMSVGDADSKKAPVPSAKNSLPVTLSPLRFENSGKEGSEDTTLRNVLDQFSLFQLGSSSGAMLDLQDPLASARQSSCRKNTDENATPNVISRDEIGKKQHKELNPTVVPPRNSSLRPNRASGSSSINSPSNTMLTAGLPKPRGGPDGSGSLRDTNRLHPLHRSTASNSEPSLLPAIDDARMCALRNASLKTFAFALTNGMPIVSQRRRSSQQELSVNDLALSRLPSSSQSSNIDDSKLEEQGKELARKCWDEDEEFLTKDKIAEWLGKQSVFAA